MGERSRIDTYPVQQKLGDKMGDNFVQERAYVYEYTYEELEMMYQQITKPSEENEDEESQSGIIIIDILGE